jgi:hypothetical protein
MSFTRFHDGSFDGILIDGEQTYIFVSTYEKEHFVILASGVAALSLTGVLAGNIILDIHVYSSDEVSVESVIDVYCYGPGSVDSEHARRSLEKVRKERLVLLTIAPSYGATCLILCKSVELVSRVEWLIRESGPGVS